MSSPLDSQHEVFDFLQNPLTHGLSGSVIRIDTHGAAVFLAGANVYKVKRAVHFPFMDFSTLAKRQAACEAEITVNRRNAPNLYLGVVPVTRADGPLRLGGDGPVVEWAVHLRRFDEDACLDRLVEHGTFNSAVIDPLAKAILRSHECAPEGNGLAATSALRNALIETSNAIMKSPDVCPLPEAEAFGIALRAAFDQAEPLLIQRGEGGQVRRCHGDLHLGNVVLIETMPVLFDAIEFSDEIATIDILYDLAFMVMDLHKRDRRGDANRLLNRYISASRDVALQLEGLTAFPLFLSLRAAIRARVLAERSRLGISGAQRQEAQSYFRAAVVFLRPVEPCLIAIGGLSGTGKTTVATSIAAQIGSAPGALHLRSDIERKRYFQSEERTRLPASAYTSHISEAVYIELRTMAEVALRAGRSVIVDATYRDFREREAIEDVAKLVNVPFFGFWLEAPRSGLMQRVADRRGDASDATAEVVATQIQPPAQDIRWQRIDASQRLDVVKATVLDLVQDHCDPGVIRE